MAKAIERAITSKSPKIRYRVTPSARVLIGQRALMTDGMWDRFVGTQFPLAGSAVSAVRVALVGDRNVGYVTHRELDAALALFPSWASGAWVGTDGDVDAALDAVDGAWVVPGTPYRDDDAVYAAIGRARETGLPLLGTCGGFQYAVVELARSLAGIDARHAETDPEADAAGGRRRWPAASSASSAR